MVKVRGKKNLVIEKSLAGPIGLFVKFSALQDYGVDKVFFLENGNADVSQQNVVFIARGESARQAQSIAGMYVLPSSRYTFWSYNRMDSKSRLSKCLDPLQTVRPEPSKHIL
jgi:hypothetical protein